MSDRMPPVHPGEILSEEFMRPMNLSQSRLSLDTGMPQSRIQAILAGKRGITADTAVRLATYFGNSAEFWLNCQVNYELEMLDYSGQHSEIVAQVHPCTSNQKPIAQSY